MLERLTRGSFPIRLPVLSNSGCRPGKAGGSPTTTLGNGVRGDDGERISDEQEDDNEGRGIDATLGQRRAGPGRERMPRYGRIEAAGDTHADDGHRAGRGHHEAGDEDAVKRCNGADRAGNQTPPRDGAVHAGQRARRRGKACLQDLENGARQRDDGRHGTNDPGCRKSERGTDGDDPSRDGDPAARSMRATDLENLCTWTSRNHRKTRRHEPAKVPPERLRQKREKRRERAIAGDDETGEQDARETRPLQR